MQEQGTQVGASYGNQAQTQASTGGSRTRAAELCPHGLEAGPRTRLARRGSEGHSSQAVSSAFTSACSLLSARV